MGRIRMHVFISNESDAALTFGHDEIAHGQYTDGWSPPSVIMPGTRGGFEGEGHMTVDPTTGTEGRVWYNIVSPGGGGGELFIHWDSPLVESQYGNTFDVWAPVDWEVSHSGGQGHDATLEIRLRRTARRNVPNFNAGGRGFAFTNNWDGRLPVVTLGFVWNKLFDSLPGPLGALGIAKMGAGNDTPLTHADQGLCGGMAFAVMDYYAAHLLPPKETIAPSSPDDILFMFIRDRLLDSFDIDGQGSRFLGYSSPLYPNGDEGVLQAVGLTRGRSWVTYREAWPQIQQDIDADHLSPVGLIQTDNLDIGSNHQVLAYGYMKSGQDVTLYIYDPDEAQKEVELHFNITQTDGEVHIHRFIHGNQQEVDPHRIYCFFRMNGYAPKMPPNGRRIEWVKEAIRASTEQQPPYSVRAAVASGGSAGSVKNWMRTL